MSQYGAYGSPRTARATATSWPTTTRARRSGTSSPAAACACCCSPPAGTLLHRRDARRPPRLSATRTYFVRRRGARVQLLSPRRKRLGTYTALRVTGRGGAVILRGRAANGRVSGAYRGAIDFRAGTFSGVDAVNSLPLDSYLRGVVPDESPPSWPIEALKAQAVAARTYAVATMKPGADLRPLPRHALAGLRRRGGRGASTNQAIAADPWRGRHLQRPAGRHLLLLDLRRAHRGRREHAARQRAAAMAEVGRRSLRRHLPAPPLGPDPDEPQAGRRQARLLRQGRLPRHRGRAAAAARRGSWRPTSSAPAGAPA